MSTLTFDTLPQPNGPDYNIYAADVFDNVMYLGGWRRAADIGPDKLYQSVIGIDDPQPLNWIRPTTIYHFNDPSVIRISASTKIMYVTTLPNEYATDTGMIDHNFTGRLISYDNGASWAWAGLVIGQWNGLDYTGAWAPSALLTASGPVLWYNTNWHDAQTGQQLDTRVYFSRLNADGSSVVSTTACIRTDTGGPLFGENVDVEQDAKGTYWLIGNDYNIGSSLVLYKSIDGIHWTPWAPWGDFGLIYSDGAVLYCPTIVSINGATMNIIYSEKFPDRTVQHTATLQLDDYTPTNFMVTNVFDGHVGESLAVNGTVYHGPVAGLAREYIQITSVNLNVVALTDNVFIASGSGDDALRAKSGYNVFDGGSGSNFLTAGSGRDTFFTHANSGADIWSTVVNFRPGLDDLTIWDMLPGAKPVWLADQGAAGFLGATLHIVDGTGHTASLTLAGYSVAQANQLLLNTGASDGHSYLNLQ